MACNILYSGGALVKSAWTGLMDTADSAVQKQLIELLDRETSKHGITYHQLRHRNLGDSHWVDVHLVFPDKFSLADAHRTATEIEGVVEASLEPRAAMTTHLESASDHDDVHLHGHGRVSTSAGGPSRSETG
jgi:divalent metal cation (Fe/Co/Zn/Cd) transporter